MKVKDIIKKQTTIIAIAVVLVTIAAISVSYAIFFDIQAGQTQTITAGTLKLTLSNLKDPLITLEPLSTEEALKKDAVNYTIQNDGDLPASYKLYICVSDSTTESLKNSIFFSNSDSITPDDGTDYDLSKKTSVSASDIQNTDKTLSGTCYEIETGTIGTGSTNQTKNLKVWVDESKLSDDIENADVNLDLVIVSEVDEASASPTSAG